MSSRILQQDSDALLTQNNEFLINENFIAANSIVTGSPVVGSTSITQDHNIAPTNISTGASVVSTTSITQDHSLSTVGVISGQVVISTAGLIQNHSLQANDLVTGNPIVPSVDATELENFTVAPVTTGTPTVGQPSFAQVHNIGLADVVTSRPIVQSADDPNAIIIAEIEEIQQMFGGWQRRTYEVPDGRLVQAEREIQATFGDVVSIDKKAKSLLKFGKSASLSIDTLETVWTVGGNESYVSDNSITHISSSSALDTQEIRVEGHTISGNDLTFVVQTVTLSGQTSVALTAGLARVSRISNNSGTELVGRVVVYEDTAVTGGIPTDATKIHIDIPLGFQQSFKAATSFSKEDYYVLSGFYGAVSAKQSAAVDFYIEIKEPDGVFLQKACFTASSSGGNSDISLDPAIIVPKNSDVRVRCETSDNNAVVFGIFKGYLAKVTG
jgi:hypothetical protein